MARPTPPSGSPDPVVWRGTGTPDDPWGDDDPFADGHLDPSVVEADAAAEAANARQRRNRRWGILGGAGLLLAATIVTGTGGSDGEPEPAPTTVPASIPQVAPDDAPTAAEVDRPVLTIDPIEGGLRYGGVGGGADVRSASARTDVPFETAWVPSRLPAAVDPAWSRSLGLDPSLALRSRDALLGAVDIGIGDESVIVVSAADDESIALTALDPVDGGVKWMANRTGRSGRLIGIAGGLVGVETGPPGDRVVALFDERDGIYVSPNGARVAEAQVELFERRAGSRDVRAELVAARSVVPVDGAGALVEDMAVALTLGTEMVIAADEVAQGRLVLLVGDGLVGARTADGARFGDDDEDEPLIVDWVRPGVLLQANPSDRGATLLVSDRTGSQQQVVDAATGRVVAELGGLSTVNGYTPTANGVIVRRPAIVGTELVAVDLDGRPVWRLLGSPPFGVGDGLVVTAAIGPDGLVVTGRR